MSTGEMPIIFVSGSARCGSSVTMQMLEAGGIPCAGQYPAYEPVESAFEHRSRSAQWLAKNVGRAVKYLDPQYGRFRYEGPAFAVWLNRNPTQQAKSQVKFLSIMARIPKLNRGDIRKLSASFAISKHDAMKLLCHWPILELNFEDIIKAPRIQCDRIASFIGAAFRFDPAAASLAVLPRPTDCMQDMEIEALLIANAPERDKAAPKQKGQTE